MTWISRQYWIASLQRHDDQDPDDNADGTADAHLEVQEGDDDDDLEEWVKKVVIRKEISTFRLQ